MSGQHLNVPQAPAKTANGPSGTGDKGSSSGMAGAAIKAQGMVGIGSEGAKLVNPYTV
jgi:hypothetical protein